MYAINHCQRVVLRSLEDGMIYARLFVTIHHPHTAPPVPSTFSLTPAVRASRCI
ncbi:hypothetical protein C8Q70DRAFT_362090 [Cubamyces menziesii]|nr:hypothetical protein C8Q70DRAFT_362090 [Cubamyces menziesii]